MGSGTGFRILTHATGIGSVFFDLYVRLAKIDCDLCTFQNADMTIRFHSRERILTVKIYLRVRQLTRLSARLAINSG